MALPLAATPLSHLVGADIQVRIDSGVIEGESDANLGIRSFKGIPFAAPPVGNLRWKEPKAVTPWTGVLQVKEFGARPMQGPSFFDKMNRDKGPSEDCLYLNLWTPARSAGGRPGSRDPPGTAGILGRQRLVGPSLPAAGSAR